MSNARAVAGLVLLAACGGDDGASIGSALVCLPNTGYPGAGGPPLVFNVLDRGDEVIAIDFQTKRPAMYDAALQVWHDIPSAPDAWHWTVDRDNSLLVMNPTGFYRSTDAKTFEMIAPGVQALTANPDGLLGRQDTGTYHVVSQNPGGALRWSPGDAAWTEGFSEISIAEQMHLTNDGAIWAAINREGNKVIYRVRPDGSAVDKIFDCASEELLYCAASIANLAINTDGDLFYYLRNDIQGVHRFYQVDAKTLMATERGRVPLPFEYGTSLAAIGDTVFFTARDSYQGGESVLFRLDPGDTTAHQLMEVQSAQTNLKTTRDGRHLYTHTPGVCEVR